MWGQDILNHEKERNKDHGAKENRLSVDQSLRLWLIILRSHNYQFPDWPPHQKHPPGALTARVHNSVLLPHKICALCL